MSIESNKVEQSKEVHEFLAFVSMLTDTFDAEQSVSSPPSTVSEPLAVADPEEEYRGFLAFVSSLIGTPDSQESVSSPSSTLSEPLGMADLEEAHFHAARGKLVRASPKLADPIPLQVALATQLPESSDFESKEEKKEAIADDVNIQPASSSSPANRLLAITDSDTAYLYATEEFPIAAANINSINETKGKLSSVFPILGDLVPLQVALSTQLPTPSSAETKDEKKEVKEDANLLYNLGMRYLTGAPSEGILQNEATAVNYFQRAAEQGHIEAILKFAKCHELGEVVPKNKAEAIKWYQIAVNIGSSEAEFRLGKCYEKGNNAGDIERAVALYKSAASKGHAGAKYALGRHFFSNLGASRDYEQAAYWFKAAAEQGHIEAKIWYAACLEQGKGVATDQAKAANLQKAAAADIYRWGWHHAHGTGGVARNEHQALECFQRGAGLREAAAKNKRIDLARSNTLEEEEEMQAVVWYGRAIRGDAVAQYQLASRYDQGKGVAKNEAEALKWYQRAVEGGNANAKFILGEKEENAKNIERAITLYKAAAEQGHKRAQFTLGVYFASRKNYEEAYEEAVEWYQKAATNGDMDAQCNLGIHYAEGWGVERNDEEAVKLYRKAAERGHAPSQFNLGRHYEKGLGAPQDLKKAAEWYQRAADQKDTGALYNLARFYLDGAGGVPYDPENAMHLLQKAADLGHKTSQDALTKLLDEEPVLSHPAESVSGNHFIIMATSVGAYVTRRLPQESTLPTSSSSSHNQVLPRIAASPSTANIPPLSLPPSVAPRQVEISEADNKYAAAVSSGSTIPTDSEEKAAYSSSSSSHDHVLPHIPASSSPGNILPLSPPPSVRRQAGISKADNKYASAVSSGSAIPVNSEEKAAYSSSSSSHDHVLPPITASSSPTNVPSLSLPSSARRRIGISDEIRLALVTNFEEGRAYDEGDCFFDSVAQGLSQIGRTIPKSKTGVIADGCKQLRLFFNDYLKKKDAPPWIKEAMDKDAETGGEDHQTCLIAIQYTQPEIELEFSNKTFFRKYSTWGRPHIEGRIICEQFRVKLHVIEFQRGNQPTHTLIDPNATPISQTVAEENVDLLSPDVIHIAIHGHHYVPIFSRRLTPPPINAPHPSSAHTVEVKASAATTTVGASASLSTPAVAHRSSPSTIAPGSAATAGAGIAGLAERDAKHGGNRRAPTESKQTFLSSSTSLSSHRR